MKRSVQVFGRKNCPDTRKALRFFKERGFTVHFVDLTEKGFSRGELANITRIIPARRLMNTGGPEYQRLNLEYIEHDAMEELLEHPLLARTPVVRMNRLATCGHAPEQWKEWLS